MQIMLGQLEVKAQACMQKICHCDGFVLTVGQDISGMGMRDEWERDHGWRAEPPEAACR